MRRVKKQSAGFDYSRVHRWTNGKVREQRIGHVAPRALPAPDSAKMTAKAVKTV